MPINKKAGEKSNATEQNIRPLFTGGCRFFTDQAVVFIVFSISGRFCRPWDRKHYDFNLKNAIFRLNKNCLSITAQKKGRQKNNTKILKKEKINYGTINFRPQRY